MTHDGTDPHDKPWLAKEESAAWNDPTAQFGRLCRENRILRGALLKTTGSLGLIIGGANRKASGHIANYNYGKEVIDETAPIPVGPKPS